MSAQIVHGRNDYYTMLEKTQTGTLDVTPWMEWFLACLGRAFNGTDVTLGAVFARRASGTNTRACRSTTGSAM
jgi:hypothetical protein